MIFSYFQKENAKSKNFQNKITYFNLDSDRTILASHAIQVNTFLVSLVYWLIFS